MKRVYVASRFESRELVIKLYDQLKVLGYEISYDWTIHKPIKPGSENIELAEEYSEIQVEEISTSDIFIYLSDSDGTTLKMELGAAIMSNKLKGKPNKIYAIGKFNNISPLFFNERVKRLNNLKELFQELETLER